MKIENDKVILEKDDVSYGLCYELQQIAYWAQNENQVKLEYHQNVYEGGVDLLDMSPDDYRILMHPVREGPAEEYIIAAYKKVAELFGAADFTLEEVLGHGA